jgi:hypothetical protein
VRLEQLGKLKKLIHFIGSGTHGLPVYSIVHHPLRYRGQIRFCIDLYGAENSEMCVDGTDLSE